MKKVFLMFLLLLIVALQAESQNKPVTINLNGSVAGASNISSNGGHTTYTRYHECWITDLDPDGDGHFHVYNWEPTIYPEEITVSIATPAKGYGYVQGQLDSAIINGTQLITGSGGKITTGSAGAWWIDYDEMKPRAKEAFYTHYVRKKADAPSGLDTTYSWSSSGRGDTYSIYWRGSASVGVTTTNGVTTSHNGIGFLSTAALVKSGQVTWSQSSLVQNGEGGAGGGSWKVVHKERCRVCKDEVGMHEHQRLCYGCLEWYECYKHPGDHIEVSCPQENGVYCSYNSYYKCSPHTHDYNSTRACGHSTSEPGDHSWGRYSCADDTHVGYKCQESNDHETYISSCTQTDSNGNTCNNSSGYYECSQHTHTYPSGSGSTAPSTPSTPSLVACGGASYTGCSGASSRTEHHVPSCSNGCGNGYWTCSEYAYRHTDSKTCKRSGCGATLTPCQNGPTKCINGGYHWL